MGKHPQASKKQSHVFCCCANPNPDPTEASLSLFMHPTTLFVHPATRTHGTWRLARWAVPVDVGIGKGVLHQISLRIVAPKSYVQV